MEEILHASHIEGLYPDESDMAKVTFQKNGSSSARAFFLPGIPSRYEFADLLSNFMARKELMLIGVLRSVSVSLGFSVNRQSSHISCLIIYNQIIPVCSVTF